MRKKIHFFIASYAIFLLLFVSCGCDCPDYNKSKIVSLQYNVYESTYVPTFIENVPITDNSVVYNKFSILFFPEVEGYYATTSKINFSNIMGAAYACSCGEPPNPEDRIQEIEITADTDYNANYLAGSDLKTAFDVVVRVGNSDIRADLADYIATNPIMPSEKMFLLLKEAPETTADFKFTVKVYLNGAGIDFVELPIRTVEIRTN